MNIKREINDDTFKLPIKEYLEYTYGCIPALYGTVFPKKIAMDCNFIIDQISPKIERGDCHYKYDKFFEVKMSYMSKNTYRIKNIRPYQKFDYYILLFADPTDNFKEYTYLLHKSAVTNNPYLKLGFMHGTKKSNENNTKVELSTNINKDNLHMVFNKHNLLKGTSYQDLMNFINSPLVGSDLKEKKNAVMNFLVKDGDEKNIISGTTNKDAFLNLITFIGPTNLYRNISEKILSRNFNEKIFYHIGENMYINPQQSVKSIKSVINSINKNIDIKVEIVKSNISIKTENLNIN